MDDPERIAGVMRACGYEVELCDSWDVGDRLPSDARALSRYSVVVLSDVEAWRLSSGHWEALDRYVRSGGGLLLVGGAYGLGASGWDACPLLSALPVLVEPGCEWRSVRPAVTGAGHPAARAVPWTECPEFHGMNPVKAKDLGFVVLADGVSGMPLLAIRPWGSGHIAVFSSDITAVWGEEFNCWEHFPAFMKVLLDCLVGPPPGFGAKEAAAVGAAAGAALPFALGWLDRVLAFLEGVAERRRRFWVARAVGYVLRGFREGIVYVRSLRLARRMAAFWTRVARVAGVASPPLLVAEAVAEGSVAYQDVPSQALVAERWARAVDAVVRVLFCGVVGGFAGFRAAAPLVPVNPVAAAGVAVVVSYFTEQAAEGFYDAMLSGRIQALVMRLMLGVR